MLAPLISAVLLTLLVLTGIPGNLLVFLVVCLKRKFHTMRYVLLASLALCDLLILSLVTLFHALSQFADSWIFGMTWCRGNALAARILFFTAVLHLCAISYERYRCVVKDPLTYSGEVTTAKLCKMVAFVWIFPLAVALIFSWQSFTYNEELKRCHQQWQIEGIPNVTGAVVVVLFFVVLPVLALIRLNFPIFKAARAQLLGTAATMNVQNTTESERRNMKKQRKENKAAIDGILIVGAFFLSFLPVCAIAVWRGIDSVPSSVTMVSVWFAQASSIWNPIIYSFRKREFRQALCLFYRKLRGGATAEDVTV